MGLKNKGKSERLLRNSAKNNHFLLLYGETRGHAMAHLFQVSESGNGRKREGNGEIGSLPFVIQSHPDSKLFEVLSRQIAFDHVDLMN